MSKLPEIPSEFIEPYLVKYFSSIIESIAMGFKTPAQAKVEMHGVECFVLMFGGIHSRIACGNEFGRIRDMPDDKLISLCVEIVKTTVGDFN